MTEFLTALSPGTNALYVAALLAGLVVHYLVAKKNGRTAAANFSDYWLVETPGLSIATLLTLATAAGAFMKSGLLDSMDGYAIFLLGFSKAYFFDSTIQAPPASTTTGVNIQTAAVDASQKGFARPGVLPWLAALALALALLPGCGVFSTGKSAILEAPAVQSLPPLGQKAQRAVDAANATLAVVYTFVRDGLNARTLAGPDADKILVKADEFSRDLDKAQDLINAGGFDAAQTKAAATQALIKILHDEAMAAAQKRSLYDIPTQGA